MLASSPLRFLHGQGYVQSSAIASDSFAPLSFQFWWRTSSHLDIRKKTASLYELRLKFSSLTCLHYLFYPNRAAFFQHPYHFHPCSDYLAEGPSTGKNFGSAGMKFGTDRLFTLQILSEPNPFFGTRAIFTRAVPKIFCGVNRPLALS